MAASRLFLDVNVVLDVAFERGAHHGPAEEVFSFIEAGGARGFVSAASYPVLYYFLRKHSDAGKAHQFLNNLRKLCKTVDLTDALVARALLSGGDLEDAVQSVSAEACGADFLITRDKEGFRGLSIPVCSPAEYLAGR